MGKKTRLTYLCISEFEGFSIFRDTGRVLRSGPRLLRYYQRKCPSFRKTTHDEEIFVSSILVNLKFFYFFLLLFPVWLLFRRAGVFAPNIVSRITSSIASVSLFSWCSYLIYVPLSCVSSSCLWALLSIPPSLAFCMLCFWRPIRVTLIASVELR